MGAGGIITGFVEQCASVEHSCSSSVTHCGFKTGVRSFLDLWGLVAQASWKNIIIMTIKNWTGREIKKRKHMNVNGSSFFLWIKCMKNIDLYAISKLSELDRYCAKWISILRVALP